MTFLQLCQRARQECGIPGDGPTTVATDQRELKRLVAWVRQSWVEIQELRSDWEWMRKDFVFDTVAGQQVYAPDTDILLTDFASWRNNSFRSYLTSAGYGSELVLSQFVSYSDFRDYYLLASRRLMQGRPIEVAIQPNKSLCLGPTPNDIYTVSGEYYKVPQELSLDTDVPDFPARFHMAIVYKTMEKYGLFESATEQVVAGQQQFNMLMNKLMEDQLPMIQQSGGLI